MRAFARNSLLAGSLLFASGAALAGSSQGIFLPSAPNGSGGEDVIETSSGARCRQSMNSNGSYLDVGAAASTSRPNPRPNASGPLDYSGYNQDTGDQALGYARVIIPLGQKPTRIDCSRMYDLEIARMRREIELLKMAAE